VRGWVEPDVAVLLGSPGIPPSGLMVLTWIARSVFPVRLAAFARRSARVTWPLAALVGACAPEPAEAPAPCICPVPRCPSQPTGAYGAVPATQPGAPSGASHAPPPAGFGTAGDWEIVQRYHGAPALQVLQGKAAYYSDALAGRPTASGEPYDPTAFTAAHRTLPFGTVLRVWGGEPQAFVYVRVNDRGPFGDDERIVDLSRAAAEALGMIQSGVIPVRVEVLVYGRGAR